MNLFYNATTGFDACYKPNLVTYKTGIKNAEPADFRIKDDIVLQKDFYDSRHRTEYPNGYLPNPNPGPKTTGVPNNRNQFGQFYKTITEFNFNLAGYTNVKNIMVQFRLDLWNVRTPNSPTNNGISCFNQSDYAFLDYIDRIECFLGSNSLPINTDMMEINDIKRYITGMNTTFQENIILGELGLDIPNATNDNNYPPTAFDFNPGNTARTIQTKVWQDVNSELSREYFKGNSSILTNIANFDKFNRTVTVPLYMLVPFFRQDQVWLPQGFPINLKITWNTNPALETLERYNILQLPFTFGISLPTGQSSAINYILSNSYSPRITYLYSRLTIDEDIKAYTSVSNMKLNYFSYIKKPYSLGTLPAKINIGNNRRLYTLVFPNPVCVRPLEVGLAANFIGVPNPNDFDDSFGYECWRNNCDLNLSVYNFEEIMNGQTIKTFSNEISKGINNLIIQNKKYALRLGGTDSETCMNSEDLAFNNSDDVKDDFVSLLSSGLNYLRGSPYSYCSAPGGMYNRQLKPTTDGVSQFTYTVDFSILTEPEDDASPTYNLLKLSEIVVYFKYLTQVIVDQDFNITLIDMPAISI